MPDKDVTAVGTRRVNTSTGEPNMIARNPDEPEPSEEHPPLGIPRFEVPPVAAADPRIAQPVPNAVEEAQKRDSDAFNKKGEEGLREASITSNTPGGHEVGTKPGKMGEAPPKDKQGGPGHQGEKSTGTGARLEERIAREQAADQAEALGGKDAREKIEGKAGPQLGDTGKDAQVTPDTQGDKGSPVKHEDQQREERERQEAARKAGTPQPGQRQSR